jgi:hypothetical protein
MAEQRGRDGMVPCPANDTVSARLEKMISDASIYWAFQADKET